MSHSVDFLSYAPEIGQAHPEMYQHIYGYETELPLIEAGLRSIVFAKPRLPLYGKQDVSAVPLALTEGTDTSRLIAHCGDRSAVIQAAQAPNLRLTPSIVEVTFNEYGHRHFFNTTLDTETGEVLIIDNDRDKKTSDDEDDNNKNTNDIWVGTFEAILDPWGAKHSDPNIYGPIFEVAILGVRNLATNKSTVERFSLHHIALPRDPELFDDGSAATDARFSLRDQDMPSQSEIEARSIRVLENTVVRVFDTETSNDLADTIAYRNTEQSTAAA